MPKGVGGLRSDRTSARLLCLTQSGPSCAEGRGPEAATPDTGGGSGPRALGLLEAIDVVDEGAVDAPEVAQRGLSGSGHLGTWA